MTYHDLFWGAASTCGRRPSNEDAHVIQTFFKPVKFTYAAVFDGHGGSSASRYSAQNLHNIIYQQKEFPDNINKAIQQSFNIVDKNYIKQEGSADIFNSAGTTANILIQYYNKFIFANAGDSRAICGTNMNDSTIRQVYSPYYMVGFVRQITKDHKPHLPEEKQRIEYYGSCVIESYDDCSRVAGMLAVSRAIGDAPFKGCGVIATPDIYTVDESEIDFIVMACDGLWDVMSNEEVAFVVHAVLSASKNVRLEVEDFRMYKIYCSTMKFLESADLKDDMSRYAEMELAYLSECQTSAASESADIVARYNEEKEKYAPGNIAKILAKMAVSLGSEDNVSVVVGVQYRLYY